ncbi:NAD(P)H-hydrate dehydratase [Nocardioides sp. NPDC092400]|uniref:NAD(P)H-hydrate dehydratase n=1 Tax=Nocardioides sp. NPDC092400 TaxID=3155196 RepID=UPI003427B124
MPTEQPEVVTPASLRAWPLPGPEGHKDARGQVVVVGGSCRSPGAPVLAAHAAFRVGAGRVAVATVDPVAPALGAAVPEAAVVWLEANDAGNIAVGAADRVAEETGSGDVLLAGSGMVDPSDASALLARALPLVEATVVLDALGSAFLTDHPGGLHHLGGRAVLSVNPDELAHVAGVDAEDVDADPAAVAADVARRSRCVVLCGGTSKHLVAPDGRSWVVRGGGPGLGVSGSGDVQAGLVAGLLARGAEPAQAAVWAAYVHGRCGERLAASVGRLGYLARELPDQAPAVLAELA